MLCAAVLGAAWAALLASILAAPRVPPPAFEVPCRQGHLLRRQGRCAEAVGFYEACLEREPRHPAAHLGLGECLIAGYGPTEAPQARHHLRRFLELATAPRWTAERRRAAEGVAELEGGLTRGLAPPPDAEALVEILLRPPARGRSRYAGPRVPLRFEFRPGDAVPIAAPVEVRRIARALAEGPLARASILVEGHTDSREGGGRLGREALSLRRAVAVRDLLVARGVPDDRLRVAGRADEDALGRNDTREGRALNRRVELVNRATRLPLRGDARNPRR